MNSSSFNRTQGYIIVMLTRLPKSRVSDPLISSQGDLLLSPQYLNHSSLHKIWSTPLLIRRSDPLLSVLLSSQGELIHCSLYSSPHKENWSTTLLTRVADPLLSILLPSQGDLTHYSLYSSPHKEIWPTTLFTPLLTRRSPWSDSLLFSQEYLNCSSLYSSQGGLIL